jgi:hypothetical protein
MPTTYHPSTHTSDLQRLVSQAVWDRKRANANHDPLGARRAERRVSELLDEFAESVLLRVGSAHLDYGS